MKPVFTIARLLIGADPWVLLRGAALSVVVLVMGAMLLGLSGWFITATGIAGMAGAGIAFDVFRPSAGVRFLALGRAVGRYGERVVTHDATLRALAALRVVLLRGYGRLDARGLAGLRSEGALTRIVSDVDALDGVILRLVLPLAAGLVAHVLAVFVMAWLVGWGVALTILAGYIPAAAAIFTVLARRGIRPSAEAEDAAQHLRRGIIDVIRDREALVLAGQLPHRETRLRMRDDQARDAGRRLDRAERDADALLAVLVAIVAMAAMVMGAATLGRADIGPAQAAIGVFVALALAEAVLPLRRGMSDLGRMMGAARRVVPHVSGPVAPVIAAQPDTPAPLLSIATAGVRVTGHAGQAIVLTGASGSGKTTLLMRIAGLGDDRGIAIKGRPPGAWPEADLRSILAVLPQRSGLIAGTVHDNLSLAGGAAPEAMWAALETVALAGDLCARGGLDLRLGEAGSGLSGGQARRLSLARIVLKRPEILLLDEPSEGLDPETADAVLTALRAALPDTLIIAAMHRGGDHRIFDRTVRLTRPSVTMSPRISREEA